EGSMREVHADVDQGIHFFPLSDLAVMDDAEHVARVDPTVDASDVVADQEPIAFDGDDLVQEEVALHADEDHVVDDERASVAGDDGHRLTILDAPAHRASARTHTGRSASFER